MHISYNLKSRLLGLAVKLFGILNIIILMLSSHPLEGSLYSGNSTIIILMLSIRPLEGRLYSGNSTIRKKLFESHFSIESLLIRFATKSSKSNIFMEFIISTIFNPVYKNKLIHLYKIEKI